MQPQKWAKAKPHRKRATSTHSPWCWWKPSLVNCLLRATRWPVCSRLVSTSCCQCLPTSGHSQVCWNVPHAPTPRAGSLHVSSVKHLLPSHAKLRDPHLSMWSELVSTNCSARCLLHQCRSLTKVMQATQQVALRVQHNQNLLWCQVKNSPKKLHEQNSRANVHRNTLLLQ